MIISPSTKNGTQLNTNQQSISINKKTTTTDNKQQQQQPIYHLES
jgi:hypothetical protein